MKVAEKLQYIALKIIDWFLIEPKRLVRLVVLSICSVVVFFQLSECFMKLLHPPISTHSHFDLNETMHYPAVTICREPGFKEDVMHKYNLSYHPSITSSWEDFLFENTTLSMLFDEATYTKDELFLIYALDGSRDNIEVITTMHFSMGRCYTLIPKVSTGFPWKRSGYAITLQHDYDISNAEMPNSDQPGFHIYLHEPRERFTEHGILSSGRIEYLNIQVNEEIELKLTVQHFTQNRGRGTHCSDDPMKSSSICSEMCRWKAVEEKVACSGPWMTSSTFNQCSNYDDTLNLITQYKHLANIDDTTCGCVQPCYSVIYSAFVMCRRYIKPSQPSSIINIYYTSKMVTNIEERPGYDSSQFVADLGGTLGFLLGLSVIGLIVVLEKILGLLFLDKFIKDYKEKKQEQAQLDKKCEKNPQKSVRDEKQNAFVVIGGDLVQGHAR